MTKKEKAQYDVTDALRDILKQALDGKKYRLDCGHYVSFGFFLGNDITIYNGKKYKIVCSQCGY
jgi:hypothetical protein